MPSLAAVVSIDQPSLTTRILDLVRSLGGAAKYGDIRRGLSDVSERTVAKAIDRLVSRRALERVMWGVYKIAGVDTSRVDFDEVRGIGKAPKRLHVVPRNPKPEPVEAEEPEPDAEPEWDAEREFRRRMWVAYAKASGQRTAGHQDDHRVDEAAAERWADRVLVLMVAGVRLREAVSAATGAEEESEVSA